MKTTAFHLFAGDIVLVLEQSVLQTGVTTRV